MDTVEPVSDVDARGVAEILRSISITDPEPTLRALARIYHPDAVFIDPLQTLRGCNEIMAMNQRLMARARELTFDVQHTAEGDGTIFLSWVMYYATRRGPRLRIEGTTLMLLEDGLVTDHVDYWDLLSSVVGTIPGVRALYRRVTALLA